MYQNIIEYLKFQQDSCISEHVSRPDDSHPRFRVPMTFHAARMLDRFENMACISHSGRSAALSTMTAAARRASWSGLLGAAVLMVTGAVMVASGGLVRAPFRQGPSGLRVKRTVRQFVRRSIFAVPLPSFDGLGDIKV